MAVTISGTNGIAVPLGTAAAPGVVNTTSATTGIYNPTSTTLGLSTNGTNAVYIDASQNVGIGRTPTLPLDISATTGNIRLTSSTGTNYAQLQAVNGSGTARFGVEGSGGGNIAAGSTAYSAVVSQAGAYSLHLGTNNTVQATIDSSGNVGIGTTSPGNRLHISGATNSVSGVSIQSTGASGRKYTIYSASTGGLYFANDTGGGDQMVLDASGNLLVGTTSLLATGTHSFVNSATPLTLRNSASTAGRYWFTGPDSSSSYLIYNNASTGVYVAYGNTTWSSTSDERMKTDLVPIENAASKVSLLRAVTGRFKTDEEGTSRSFLIAQDVQAVLPEAVDASDPDKLGVQYTDVIPLLVAAIKELSAEVEALKAKVGA